MFLVSRVFLCFAFRIRFANTRNPTQLLTTQKTRHNMYEFSMSAVEFDANQRSLVDFFASEQIAGTSIIVARVIVALQLALFCALGSIIDRHRRNRSRLRRVRDAFATAVPRVNGARRARQGSIFRNSFLSFLIRC